MAKLHKCLYCGDEKVFLKGAPDDGRLGESAHTKALCAHVWQVIRTSAPAWSAVEETRIQAAGYREE
jgi:hypothetical protein